MAALLLSVAFALGGVSEAVAREPSAPGWLTLAPGTIVRVDLAPWSSAAPEAALAASVRSIEKYGGDEVAEPEDVVREPVGVRAVVARLIGKRVALVRGLFGRWKAYARVERLIPEVPPGTLLVVAGGFEGFADIYPSLSSPAHSARHIETGTRLVAINLGVGRFDPQASALVRVGVRIVSGKARGHFGWLDVAYTGVPMPHGRLGSSAERACTCRIVAFGDPE